jgi:hypothetical protein
MKGVYDEYADPSYCNPVAEGSARYVSPLAKVKSKDPIEKEAEQDDDE